jgi:ABC-2 type transport system permease protein
VIAVFRLVLRSQLTKGRLVGLVAFGAIGLLIALSLRAADPLDRPEIAYGLVLNYAVALLAPLTALIFASSALGDTVDDRTLVYLWLRPRPRWQIATAATAASWFISLPFIVVPAAGMAAIGGTDGALVVAAAVASAMAVAAYGALFVGLGLIVRRALVWGLVYILIWEGFVARSGTGASRISILYYVRTLLAEVADHELPALHTSLPVAIIVPLAVAAVALVLTSYALRRVDVA